MMIFMEHDEVMKILKAINKNTEALKEATAIERQKNAILTELVEVLKDGKQ